MRSSDAFRGELLLICRRQKQAQKAMNVDCVPERRYRPQMKPATQCSLSVFQCPVCAIAVVSLYGVCEPRSARLFWRSVRTQDQTKGMWKTDGTIYKRVAQNTSRLAYPLTILLISCYGCRDKRHDGRTQVGTRLRVLVPRAAPNPAFARRVVRF